MTVKEDVTNHSSLAMNAKITGLSVKKTWSNSSSESPRASTDGWRTQDINHVNKANL